MPNNHIERSFYGFRLQKYLETANPQELFSITDYMCKALLEAYIAVSVNYVVIDMEIPGERITSTGDKGVEDPRQPGDEPDKPLIKVYVSQGYNEEQSRILHEALRWGCEWAQKEAKVIPIEMEKHK